MLAGFTAGAGALVALARGAEPVAQIVAETAWFVAIVSPKIAAGIEWHAALYTLAFARPPVVLALLGAGFFAELLPPEQVQRFFGAEAGAAGIVLDIALGH